MDEVWLRLGLVATAGVVGGVTTLALRSRSASRPSKVAATGLTTGVYLFTSAGCSDCRPAREKLRARLGETGFVEVDWETQAGLFGRIGIEVVPATLIVAPDGSGLIWPGQPEKALARLGP